MGGLCSCQTVITGAVTCDDEVLCYALLRLSPGAITSRESSLGNDFIILKHMSANSQKRLCHDSLRWTQGPQNPMHCNALLKYHQNTIFGQSQTIMLVASNVPYIIFGNHSLLHDMLCICFAICILLHMFCSTCFASTVLLLIFCYICFATYVLIHMFCCICWTFQVMKQAVKKARRPCVGCQGGGKHSLW